MNGTNDRPEGAFIISLTAGLVIGTVGVIWLYTMSAGWFPGWMNWYDDFMHGIDGHLHFMDFSALGWASGYLGILSGIGVVLSAIMLHRRPTEHERWGAAVLVLSVLSIFGGMGGMGLGVLLGVLGGILAIVWSPRSHSEQVT